MVEARRRSEASRLAILSSCSSLMRQLGPSAVTIEGVARLAGVGKQTIYRWWSSRGALLVDALLVERDQPDLSFPDTNDLTSDLESALINVTRVLMAPEYGPMLAAVLGEMQRDPQLRDAFNEAVFGPVRRRHRERLRQARESGQLATPQSDDTVLDAAFGPLWFRLLTRPEALNEQFARDVAAIVSSVVQRTQ